MTDTVYLVWMFNDDTDPMLIGIGTTEDKANVIINKSKKVMENAFEYKVQPFEINAVITNDVKHYV